MENSNLIIRPKRLSEMLDVSSTTIWRMEQRNQLPPKRRFSNNITGWLRTEIDEWLINTPINGKLN